MQLNYHEIVKRIITSCQTHCEIHNVIDRQLDTRKKSSAILLAGIATASSNKSSNSAHLFYNPEQRRFIKQNFQTGFFISSRMGHAEKK